MAKKVRQTAEIAAQLRAYIKKRWLLISRIGGCMHACIYRENNYIAELARADTTRGCPILFHEMSRERALTLSSIISTPNRTTYTPIGPARSFFRVFFFLFLHSLLVFLNARTSFARRLGYRVSLSRVCVRLSVWLNWLDCLLHRLICSLLCPIYMYYRCRVLFFRLYMREVVSCQVSV